MSGTWQVVLVVLVGSSLVVRAALTNGWDGGASPVIGKVLCWLASRCTWKRRHDMYEEFRSQIGGDDLVKDPCWVGVQFLAGELWQLAARTVRRAPVPDSCLVSALDPTRTELQALLRSAVDELPLFQKVVLTLYFYDDFTVNEIAEHLQTSQSKVTQARTSAVIALQDVVDQMYPPG